MGRKPKSLREAIGAVLQEESTNGMKEFNVKVTDENGKSWIGYVRARNHDSAISQMADGLPKAKTLSFQIV